MEEPSRRCKKCGYPLSVYNKSDECFRHYEYSAKNSTNSTPVKPSRKSPKPGKIPPMVSGANVEPNPDSGPGIKTTDDDTQKTGTDIPALHMLDAISAVYKINKEELCGDIRERRTVLARRTLIYLLWEELRTPAPDIARLLKIKNVITIKTGYQKIKKLTQEDTATRRIVGNIRAFYRKYYGT